jgi:acyl-CoA synthetase (AMP-forming)/AMP-acid ligase II
METLADLIERNARVHGDLPCLVGKRPLTHADYARRCWRLADAWAQAGVQPGDRVAFLLRNGAEALEVYGAAESGGFVAVPLNWRLAARELAQVLADCEPRAIVTCREFEGTLRAACDTARLDPAISLVDDAVPSYEALLAKGAPARPPHRPGPADLAHIVYTSGTTGRPKGALWTHGAVLAAALDLALGTGARPNDRIVLPMPLFHVGAKIEWLGVQVVGGSCIPLAQFDEEAFFRAVQDQGGNTAHLAPTMVQRIVRHPARTAYRLDGLRRVQYGSAPVRGDDLRAAVAAFGPVFFQVYGMTEHLCISILSPWDQALDGTAAQQARLESAGKPFPRTRLRIVADDGTDAAPGQEGEILVRSPGMSSGYYRLDAAGRRMPTAGCAPATSAAGTRTASCTWWTGART